MIIPLEAVLANNCTGHHFQGHSTTTKKKSKTNCQNILTSKHKQIQVFYKQ